MPSMLPVTPRGVHEFRQNLIEDLGLVDLVAQRDDGHFHEGTTADFLAEVEQQST